ncbi:MAG: hypothetical protein U0807_19280 [Candidatus Binatia bacterium]
MRVLSNDDVERLVTMPECMDALEAMYRDLADDRALASPRMDSITPSRHEGAYYAFKQMGGTWPSRGMQALRLNSDVITHPVVDGKPRRVLRPPPTDAGSGWWRLQHRHASSSRSSPTASRSGCASARRTGCGAGITSRGATRGPWRSSLPVGRRAPS